MKRFNEFIIPFVGLKEGKHQFEFQIEKSFFDAFDYDEFEDVKIKVTVELDKKSTFLTFNFKSEGSVRLPHDSTGELFDLPVEGSLLVIVKFGKTFDDSNDDVLILPHEAYQVDIKQYVYEMILLSIPQRRVTLAEQAEALEEEFDEFENENIEGENQDPRWNLLKQLLDKK